MATTTTFAARAWRWRGGRLLGLAAAAALLAAARPAAAQEAGVDRTAAARALFDEGLALLDAERWAEAADRFQRALALRPSPQITYNLTTALIPLGRLVRASELLRQLSLDPAATPEVRQAAEARRAEIVPRIASLTIVVPRDLAGADLLLDERPLDPAMIGVAVPVDPGHHVASARREGREVARREVDLLDGEDVELALGQPLEGGEGVALDAGVGATPGERTRPRSRSVARSWWLWTIVGAVVVGGAVTAGVLVGTRDQQWPDPVQGPGATVIIGGDE